MLRSITRPVTSPVARAVNAGAVIQWLLKIIGYFNGVTGWTLTNTGANSRIVSGVGDGVFSPNALNFNSDAVVGSNSTATANITPNLDLSSEPGFWLHARVNFRQTASQVGLTTYMSNSDGLAGGVGRWQAANLIYSGAVGLQPHWVPKSRFSVLDGAPSYSLPIKSWRFRIDSGAEAHDFDLCGVTIEKRRPTVIITHDDGWDSSYSIAFAEGQSRGIPQTHYLIASLIGAAGYITQAQAAEMRAAGDYLGLHGALRWDQDLSRIAADAAALTAIGIDTGHAAYPEGQIGSGISWTETIAALQAVGVKTARLAGGATPTLRHRTDPYCITSYPLNNSMTLAGAKSAVDAAIESGGTVFFYGHKYGATADSLTWTQADLAALYDYIALKRDAGAIDVKTVQQWWGA